ncbi:single-stranded DNA-binding protein [Gardnerella greenwoodii]|uniref:single-stranded DNA-binding protein n=1 Tax=Gardnerella greenwoodii TaxID=2914925 RepID=UPI0039EF43B6
MAGETTITIVGNLTADPELRTIQSTGTQVVTFTIASTPRTFDKNQNQYVDGASLFMRCQAWRDLAAHIASSLAKGMRVVATGRLSQRTYEDQTGTKHTVVEMTVDEIGASLRYATCQVTKTSTSTGFVGSTPQTAPAQAAQSQTNAWTQATPSQDPWGNTEPDPEF